MRAGPLRLLAVALVGALLGTGLGVLVLAPATQPLFTGATREEENPPDWRDLPPPPVPTAPRLESPSDGAVVPTRRPTLEWAPSESPVKVIYAIQLSKDPSFTSLGGAGQTVSAPLLVVGVEGTNFTLPSDLALTPGVPVYWRVRSLDVYLQDSPWSQVWSFVPLAVTVERDRTPQPQVPSTVFN